ncbi:endonuclease/exonuclease/phosphatase family protein, partial [Salmonella enterica subsp. enterica serovar Infantis]|nr:endonuclease/exonuclease/phosphatase family protein [Salmonella enterica subsp. enterica serovar Infantis]
MDSTKKIQRNLKIATWNCNGLSRKKDELASYMEDHSTDIMLLQEVKMNPSEDIKMLNYKVYRSDRTAYRGGGIAILVNSGIVHH